MSVINFPVRCGVVSGVWSVYGHAARGDRTARRVSYAYWSVGGGVVCGWMVVTSRSVRTAEPGVKDGC